jgi:hypothetical protein
MPNWYIDALDARAGMGLATYRDADLNSGTVDLGRPAVFIGPPFFQAESVASRAIGFAATRGSFQLGLFLNNGEVAFPSLQGVCEFIRRVYISSGGGDTDGGISTAPVEPNPESGGGELPPVPEGEDAITRGMLGFVDSLNQGVAAISGLDYSQSKPKEWNRREGNNPISLVKAIGSFGNISTLLGYGVAVLVEEMMLRFPNKRTDYGAWMGTMMRLGHVVRRLGLLDSLFNGPESDRLERMASNIERRVSLFSDHLLDFGVLATMLGLGPHVLWYSRDSLYVIGGNYGPDIDEPLDDLSRLPIPSIAAKHLRLNPKTASARDLLSVFLADPTVLAGEKASRPEATTIVACALLFSMLITSTGQISLAPIAGAAIGDIIRQDRLRDAIVWIDTQMPGYLFHQDIEKHIRSASQLRYGSRPDESESATYVASLSTA